MARALPTVCLACFALLSAACGGTDEGRPSASAGAASLDPCRADDGYEFQSIMDFEPTIVRGEPDPTVLCNPELGLSAGQQCSFYFNYDLAHSVNSPELQQQVDISQTHDCVKIVVPDQAVSNPRATDGTFYSEPIGDGRCGAPGSGLHITARNIGMCIGSNGRLGWGASLDVTFATPLDASAWDGVALWTRRGSDVGGRAIIMSVVDPYTSGAMDPDTLQAHCNATEQAAGQPVVPDSEKCDAFGTVITLTEGWTFVPAVFEGMRQKGFGVASPLGRVDSTRIVRMQLLMTAGDWDVWIDDLALFRKPE